MKANLSTGWSGVEWNGSSQHHTKAAIAQNVGDFEQKKQKKCKKQSQERKKERNQQQHGTAKNEEKSSAFDGKYRLLAIHKHARTQAKILR